MSDYRAADHLKQISKKDYLPAVERMIAFSKERTDGNVTTELIKNHYEFEIVNDQDGNPTIKDKSYAIAKATVFYQLDGGKCCITTGHGMESAKDFPNNWVEKAETKAIARGLDRIGYGNTYAMMQKAGIKELDPQTRVQAMGSGSNSFDYMLVPWRVAWLLQENQEIRIETEIQYLDMDKHVAKPGFKWNDRKRIKEATVDEGHGIVVFKATVSGNNVGLRDGTAQARAVDFPDFIEYGETKAIGRALAAFGYNVRGAEEYDEGERIVDAPLSFPGVEVPGAKEEQHEQQTQEEVKKPQKPQQPAAQTPVTPAPAAAKVVSNGVVLPAKPTPATPAKPVQPSTPPAQPAAAKREPPRGTNDAAAREEKAATEAEVAPLKEKLKGYAQALSKEELNVLKVYRGEQHPPLKKLPAEWTPADYVKAEKLTREWIEARKAPVALKAKPGTTLSPEQSEQLLCDLAAKLDKGYTHLYTTFGIKHPQDLGGVKLEGSDVEPREAEARYDYIYYLSQQTFNLEGVAREIGYAPEHIQALFASVES